MGGDTEIIMIRLSRTSQQVGHALILGVMWVMRAGVEVRAPGGAWCFSQAVVLELDPTGGGFLASLGKRVALRVEGCNYVGKAVGGGPHRDHQAVVL